jgi:hypothetical protein
MRSGRQHFTYSKVMAWVAFDRSIKTMEAFGLDGQLERWRRIRGPLPGKSRTYKLPRSRGTRCSVKARTSMSNSAHQ